jgi:hypothetical protein
MRIHSHFKIKSLSHAVRNIISSNIGLGVKKIVNFLVIYSEGKSGRLLKIDPNFNVSFPTTACSPTFHKNERAAL